jgi:hypothetical protein
LTTTSKTANPKFEARNSKPARISKIQNKTNPKRLKPRELNFAFKLFEFRIPGDHRALIDFGQGGGKTIGVGQPVAGLEGGRQSGQGPVGIDDFEPQSFYFLYSLVGLFLRAGPGQAVPDFSQVYGGQQQTTAGLVGPDNQVFHFSRGRFILQKGHERPTVKYLRFSRAIRHLFPSPGPPAALSTPLNP